MPVRRFFAMTRAARKLKVQDTMEAITLHAIPLTNAKYVEELREYYTREWDALSGFDPYAQIPEPSDRALTDEQHQNVNNQLMGLLAMRRRIHG